MKKIVLLAVAFLFLINIASASTQIEVNKYEAGFSLSAYSVPETNCKCAFIEDVYLLKNTADITQGFSITNSEGLTQNVIGATLKPGASRLITISAPLACNAAEFDYELKIISSLGEVRQLNRNLVTERCQNLHLALYLINESILPNSTIDYTVTITNVAPFAETYLVSSERLNSFVRNEAYQLTLPAFGQQNITFTYDFTPDFFGNYTATFKARAETNQLTSVVSDDINIERIYGFKLQAEEQTICIELDNPITFNITNEGATANIYYLDVIGNLAYSLESSEVFLESGETKEVTIFPNKDDVGKENVIVKATTKYGNMESEIYIPVDVINCYNLQLEVPNRISQCNEAGEHAVTLTNNGILPEQITLQLQGNASLSDEQLIIEPNSSTTVKIVIEPEGRIDETLILNITASDNVNRIYNIPTVVATEEECQKPNLQNYIFETTKQETSFEIIIENVGEKDATYELSIDNNADITPSEITINAKQTATVLMQVDLTSREFADYAFTLTLEADKGTYEELITVKYQDRSYFAKVISFLNTNWCLWILIGLVIVAFAAFVYWIFVPEQGGSLITAKIVGIILLIIVVGSVITLLYTEGLPGSLHTPLENDLENLHYKFYVGEDINFDLNNFFIDLDNDKLFFEVISEQSYELSEEGIATFHLGEGTYEVNFVAFDLEIETRSPPVTIEVQEKQGIGLGAFLVKYCGWLNWLLLLVFSVFLFFALLKHSTSEQEKLKQKEAKKAELKAKREAKKKTIKKTTKRVAKKTSKKRAKRRSKKK